MSDYYKNITMQSKKEQKSSSVGLGSWILSFFIGGLILMWYNYIYLQYPIAYWQLVIMSVVVAFLANIGKPFRYFMTIVFSGAVICQVLKWIGVIHSFPLFHINH